MRVERVLGAFFAGISMSAGAAAAELTYTKDVSPILNANCLACHRAGQMAPMAFTSYEEVRPWAKSIREMVSAKKMPPWHATQHVGTFVNDRSLTADEIATIVSWIDQGAPRGNPSDLPPAPAHVEGEWQLGAPDVVVTLAPKEIPADGPDLFGRVPGKVALTEDRWISAVEILPGDKRSVHHVIVLQLKGFDFDPEGGWMGAWAAGTEPMVFPEGTGRLLEKGANLIGDMHWHPYGEATTDETRIGLHFADDNRVEKELVNLWIAADDFLIPAGDPNYEVRAKHTFQQDAFVMAFAPHMHFRGQDFTYTAHYPDGRSEVLLRVDDYDFNWQTNYVLAERMPVPKGTTIECVAHFDNSADNPVNPDPTRNVPFGEESFDEMMIGFMDYVVADGVRPKSDEDIRAEYRDAWLAANPADVYGLYVRNKSRLAPLYLPRAGDGKVVLRVNGSLTELSVSGLTWSGDGFTSRVALGEIECTFNGTLDPATGEIDAILDGPQDIHVEFKGMRLEPAAQPGTD